MDSILDSFSYGSRPGLGLGAVLGPGTTQLGEPTAAAGRPQRQLSITKCSIKPALGKYLSTW